ncbi:MAG: hypothetical protein GF320_20340 [Armatimonadia bacterium]|nr:hypothetical protein [Armatimonadia bacterium]
MWASWPRRHAVIGAVLLALLGSAAPGQVELKYDDGQADGKRSTAQAGYITVFEVPEGNSVLQSISFHASRYGRDYPRDITIAVTDMDLNPIGVFGMSYLSIPYGNTPSWVTFDLPTEIQPPDRFAVAIYAHCLRDCGVYMSLDAAPQGQAWSYSTRRGSNEAPMPDLDGAPANWMIRCQMTDEFTPPENAPVQLGHGALVPTGKQSFGGSAQATTFVEPEDESYAIERVYICASYYGQPADGEANNLDLYILDGNGNAIAGGKYRYDEVYWGGEPGWTSLPLPEPIEVPTHFTVVTSMNSRQTPGVFLAYTDGADANHCMVGSLQNGFEPWSIPQGDAATGAWCIRCDLVPTSALAPEEPAEPEEPLLGG